MEDDRSEAQRNDSIPQLNTKTHSGFNHGLKSVQNGFVPQCGRYDWLLYLGLTNGTLIHLYREVLLQCTDIYVPMTFSVTNKHNISYHRLAHFQPKILAGYPLNPCALSVDAHLDQLARFKINLVAGNVLGDKPSLLLACFEVLVLWFCS